MFTMKCVNGYIVSYWVGEGEGGEDLASTVAAGHVSL